MLQLNRLVKVFMTCFCHFTVYIELEALYSLNRVQLHCCTPMFMDIKDAFVATSCMHACQHM